MTLRLAMWSGPRNISTALMRSFGNRPDTAVVDEPLYAHYLAVTRAPHPGAEEVVRCHESDWRKVASALLGPVPGGKAVFYQKHMAHHLLPEIERGWLAGLQHAFLIRDPREMLPSLAKVTPRPSLADTGLPQQVELFEAVRRERGSVPAVIDARDVLADPARVLARLCERVGLDFRAVMLAWPSGPRDTDGVWSKHWYADVLRSTGFEPRRPRAAELGAELARVHAECVPLYEALARHRIAA